GRPPAPPDGPPAGRRREGDQLDVLDSYPLSRGLTNNVQPVAEDDLHSLRQTHPPGMHRPGLLIALRNGGTPLVHLVVRPGHPLQTQHQRPGIPFPLRLLRAPRHVPQLPHEGKLLSGDVLQLPRHDPEVLGPALHPAGPRIGVPHGEPRVLERPRPLTPPPRPRSRGPWPSAPPSTPAHRRTSRRTPGSRTSAATHSTRRGAPSRPPDPASRPRRPAPPAPPPGRARPRRPHPRPAAPRPRDRPRAATPPDSRKPQAPDRKRARHRARRHRSHRPPRRRAQRARGHRSHRLESPW